MLLYTVIPPREIHVTDPKSGSSAGKESTCNAGDLGLIPGLGRSPGEGKGYPLQYSSLENSMDCKVLGVAKTVIQFTCAMQISCLDFPDSSVGKSR